MKLNKNYLQQLRTINELATTIDSVPTALVYTAIAVTTIITLLYSV